GFTVSVRCGFNPRRPYGRADRGFNYDRAFRSLSAPSGRYDRPAGRAPYYADPGWEVCPPAVGGVTVVSPPNRRSPQGGYTGYLLVRPADTRGCVAQRTRE